MPGLNTIISFIGRQDIDRSNLTSILKSMDYGPSYLHGTVYDDRRVAVFSSGYDGYPGQKIEFDDKVIIIEGAIYNKSLQQVEDELTKILPQLVNNPEKTDSLREFMFNTDGEYIIYYIDNASSSVVIFNDALGRLPAYYYADDNGLIVARAMKFLTGLIPVEYDQNALMEYFLFSAPLGERTFFKGVFRIAPCSLFVINWRNCQCDRRVLYRYNFDDRWDDRPVADYVQNLHDQFLAGLSNRALYFNNRKQILSLSGGLDSRANLMGLLKLKIDFEAVTFHDFYNRLTRDLAVAQTLQKMYNFKLKAFDLIEENIPYFERMVNVKDGMAMMGTMGSVLNSMEVVEKEYGPNSVYFVGDGGSSITAPRYSGKQIDSMPVLVNEILQKNRLSVFSVGDIARLFGKTPEDVTNYLCDYFSSYPEKDNLHRIDHFYFWERSFKFTMEGQDRIRLYFWPIAPHYSIAYARYALQINNKYLAGWKIYRDFLKALDGRAASVKYANFGISLDSRVLPIYLKMRSIATANESVKRMLNTVLRFANNPSNIGRQTLEWKFIRQFREYLAIMIRDNSCIESHLDTKVLAGLLRSERHLHRMYVVGNLIKYMSLIEGKNEMPNAPA